VRMLTRTVVLHRFELEGVTVTPLQLVASVTEEVTYLTDT
jgi:hypothetical protein